MATTALRLPELATSTLRRHRSAIIAWVAGAGGFLLLFGLGYRATIRDFPGGAAAFGAAAQAPAEAMRALVGPVTRLDTFGGYTTYHNLGYAPLLLGIWAVMQGAKAIRGAEERGMLQLWLATGRSRPRVLADQVLGFLMALGAIVLGTGVLAGAGSAVAGFPSWGRSLAAIGIVAVVAAIFFALSLVVSQLVSRSRLATGISGGIMLGLYLLGNLAGQLGHFAWLRWASPFWYAQQSRMLVPGQGLDVATAALSIALIVTFCVTAGALFVHRDIDAGALVTRHREEENAQVFALRRPWLAQLWSASIVEQRFSLLFWFLGPLVFLTLYVSMTPTITKSWASSDLIRRFLSATGTSNVVDQFLSLVMVLAAPLVSVYAVTQAARWVRDREQRRTELEFSCPLSRRRLWLQRMAALAAGTLVVIAGSLTGFLLGSAPGNVSLRLDGLARGAGVLMLLGLATGGVAALSVALLRTSAAIGALGGYLGASFFLTLLAPLLGWPGWVSRLSLFDAFGHPYVSTGPMLGILLLAGLALVGVVGTLMVSERRSEAP